MFILRAHHLLCMQGFRGKGYSEGFTKHLAKIVESLSENPDIKIITDVDEICKFCPHNEGKQCEKKDYIYSLDQKVLKALKIEKNLTYSYEEIKNRIKKYLTFKQFCDICSDCEWYELGYCKEGIENIKNKI